LMKSWKDDSVLSKFTVFKNRKINNLSIAENKAIDVLIKIIKTSNDLQYEALKKKSNSIVSQSSSGIILISYKSKDELLAKNFVEAIYKNLSSFYVETISKNLKTNYDLVSARADSISKIMRSSEEETAIAFDESIGVFKYKGKVKSNRLRRDNELLNLMYAEVIKNKEIAKFNLDQERPVLQIIDEPTLPLEQHYKSTIIFTILGAIVTTFLLFSILSVYFLMKNNS